LLGGTDGVLLPWRFRNYRWKPNSKKDL